MSTQTPAPVKLTHWARKEGASAAAQGYTGANPYMGQPGDAAFHWRDGYLAEVAKRLNNGLAAVKNG